MNYQDNQNTPEAVKKPIFFSSLDSIETTAHFTIPESLHERRFQDDPDEFRQTSAVLSHIYQFRNPETLRRFDACGSDAFFFYDENSGHIAVRANSCHIRWCPACAAARAGLVAGRLFDWLAAIERPTFITLTHQHRVGESISAGLRRLHESFRHFRRLKAVRENMRGGVWFLQVKRGRDSCWHAHIHIAADCSYIPQRELSGLWLQSTGDSSIVDIRAVHNKEKLASYIARYVSRPARLSDFNFSDAVEIVTSLRGRRLFGKWGNAAQLKFNNRESEEQERKLVKIGSWKLLKKACDDNIYDEPRKLWNAYILHEPISADLFERCRDILDAYHRCDSSA